MLKSVNYIPTAYSATILSASSLCIVVGLPVSKEGGAKLANENGKQYNLGISNWIIIERGWQGRSRLLPPGCYRIRALSYLGVETRVHDETDVAQFVVFRGEDRASIGIQSTRTLSNLMAPTVRAAWPISSLITLSVLFKLDKQCNRSALSICISCDGPYRSINSTLSY